MQDVHEACLVKWIQVSQNATCEICKSDYECVAVDDVKPHFAEIGSPLNTVRCFGATIFIFIQTYSILFPEKIEYVFIYANILQLLTSCIIYCSYQEVNLLSYLLYWKTCSMLGFTLTSVFLGDWTVTKYEAAMVCALSMLSYLNTKTNADDDDDDGPERRLVI